jgi:hypothetical protein
MRPRVDRIAELHPRLRRIHVVGEMHPGELADRGYRDGALEIRTTDELIREFQALRDRGYLFRRGGEWSPAELYAKFAAAGRLKGACAVFEEGETNGVADTAAGL